MFRKQIQLLCLRLSLFIIIFLSWFDKIDKNSKYRSLHKDIIIHYRYRIWLGCCMRANSMYEISSNQPTLVACPGLMWCATGLRFYYIGDTDPESKLAIGIGHLWSWAGFMAAHIWAINFAINYELHQYSGDNNEPICCPKCSFKLI